MALENKLNTMSGENYYDVLFPTVLQDTQKHKWQVDSCGNILTIHFFIVITFRRQTSTSCRQKGAIYNRSYVLLARGVSPGLCSNGVRLHE